MLKVYSCKKYRIISIVAVLVIIISLFTINSAPAYAAGATYYVSSSTGSDSNNGTSPSTPWKTLAKACSITHQAGNQILLKCGDTWNEQFTLNGSGTSSNPVVLSSYGAGNQPKIQRSNKDADICIYGQNVAGWKIMNLELNTGWKGVELYYSTYDNDYIWIENCNFYNFDTLNSPSIGNVEGQGNAIQIAAVLADHNRTALSNITVKGCYVNKATIGFTNVAHESFDNFKNINISNSFFEDICTAGIQLNHCTGATISHCTVLRSGTAVVQTGTIGALQGFVKDVHYINCEFAETLKLQAADGGGFDHECGDDLVTFTNCLFHENAGYGTMFFDNGRDASNRNVRYENCVFYMNNVNPPPSSSEIQFMNGTFNNAVFERNRIYARPGFSAFGTSGTGNLNYSHFIDNIHTSTGETNGTNYAINAAASVSTQYDSSYSGTKANDNSTGTMWKSAAGTSSGQWLELAFSAPTALNKVIVDEDSSSSINRFKIQYWDSTSSMWYDCFNGTTIGSVKQMPIAEITTTKIRLLVRSTASGTPAIREFGAYKVSYAAPTQSSGHLEDFNGSTLNPAWSWVRQDSNNWSLAAKSGKMRINCQAGDLQGSTNTAKNILLRNPGSNNFTISTRVEFRNNVDNQQAGLIIYDNDDNYIKLEKTYITNGAYQYGKNAYYIQGAAEINGTYSTFQTVYYPPIASLKIDKDGSTYSLYYRKEETDIWNKLTTFTNINFSSNVKVGLISFGASSPAVNADFDWFDLSTQSPYGGTNWTLPGIVEAENYDNGGEGAAYHDEDAGNRQGQYRTGDVDIEACGDAGEGYDVGCINEAAGGEWLEYTVNIPSGVYNIAARVAGHSTNGSLKIYLDGTLIGTIGVPNTGGWQNWQTAVLRDVNITGGNSKILRIEFYGSQYNFNWVRFEQNVATGKSAAASSIESSSFGASNAVDNNLESRWSSQFSDPQWIYVDLGAVYNVDAVRLRWEVAYGRAYKIQVSATGTNDSDFTDVYSTGNGDGGIDDIVFNPVNARYVRMYGTQRANNSYGYSLWEFQIYGAPTGIVKAWEFSNNTEGWSAVNQISGFGWQSGIGSIGGTVAGADPFIMSGDNLNVDISNYKKIHISMKNSTPSTDGRLYFTTNADTTLNEAKAAPVVLVANDGNYTEYVIDMTNVQGWTGILKQLRFDPENNATSGSFSIDHIRIMNQ